MPSGGGSGGGGVLVHFSTGSSPGDADCSSQGLRNGTLNPWHPDLYTHLHVRLSTAATGCVLLLAPRSGDHGWDRQPAPAGCEPWCASASSVTRRESWGRATPLNLAARCHLLRCRGRAAGRRGPGHGSAGTWQGPAGSQPCPLALPTPGQLETAELRPNPSLEPWPPHAG